MQITKYFHSCVLLDDGQTKLLFDPGLYGGIPVGLKVGGVVITHVHQDHLDLEQLKPLLYDNLPIITNSEVKEVLDKEGIDCQVVEQGSSITVGTFFLEAFGNEHAIMHPELPKFQNTGYLVNGKIFHPGDALYVPPQTPEVLLLPVAAPWSKIEETLDYIESVKAKVNFPIHDGFLTLGGAFYRFAKMWCEKYDLKFIEPELGTTYEI